MRVVCLITIGAFLICVSTAENQIKPKRPSKNIHHQSHHRRLRQLSNGDQRLSHHSKPRSAESSARSDSFSPLNHSGDSAKNDIDNSIVKTAAKHVGELDDEEPIYLEPVIHRHGKSWLDDLRSVLDIKVEPQKNSGPLIGPLSVAGLGNKVYIRHPGHFDDDTERIYVHIVTKEIPVDDVVQDNDVSHDLKSENNGHPFTKTVLPPATFAIAASSSSFGRSRPGDQDQWASDKEDLVSKSSVKDMKHALPSVITPRKSSVSRSDTVHDESTGGTGESKFTMVLIKQAGQKPPSVVWSKPVHRRMPPQTYTRRQRQSVLRRKVPRKQQPQPSRHRMPTRLKSVKMRNRQTAQKSSKSIKYSQPIAPLNQGFLNDTEVHGESNFTGGFRPVAFTEKDVVTWKPTTTTDGVSIATESSSQIRYITRVIQSPSTSTTVTPDPKARFRYRTVSKPSATSDDIGWKEFKPSQGGLQVVSAPNLKPAERRSGEKSDSHNNVVQSIMTMTASQIWETRQKVDSDYKNSDTIQESQTAQDRMDKFDEFSDDDENEKESESEIVSVVAQSKQDLGPDRKKVDTFKMGEELWRNIRNSQPWTLQLKLLKSEEEVLKSQSSGKPEVITDRDHRYEGEVVPENHRKEQ